MTKTAAHNAACPAFHQGGVKAAVTMFILEASLTDWTADGWKKEQNRSRFST